MRRLLCLALVCLCLAPLAQAQKYRYEHVEGDPMDARIYTLDNGLKVYLTNNPSKPRIQTYIAVRAGGKNDPAESTGLAHYLEHLMFKGTSSFGTGDYEHERPLLDSIQNLYEVYGKTTGVEERRAIYHRIDSFSYEASRHAIANEYDKLMSAIGSQGSNAYTTSDVTCYIEDIPANEVERWAMVQSNRFRDLVIRGFHTELESVYEEYNISLTRDFDKVYNAVNQALFPHHPYGKQTVIGTQEHLKNPSLQNVLRYYHTYYVPNNVAICMSGDIADMDSIVGVIDRYFGDWERGGDFPTVKMEQELPIGAPIEKEVMGRETDMVALAWPLPGASNRDCDYLEMLDLLLNNGHAGLFDIHLNQSQEVMGSESFTDEMTDYSSFWVVGYPKEGQTLDEVRNLLLREIARLRTGDFDEALIQAIIANKKQQHMKEMLSNSDRADKMLNCFVNGIAWADEVHRMERIGHITKEDIMAFAQKYLTDGYACIYKRQGEDPNEKKIEKPQISPILMNRDHQSDFVSQVQSIPVKDISPVFVDFERQMSTKTLKNGNELVYKQNNEDELFDLIYRIYRGSKADPELDVACNLIDYMGTKKMDAEELQTALYSIACTATINCTEWYTFVHISGLQENMEKAMQITEDWLNNALADKEIYASLVEDILKAREDGKLEQKNNYTCLVQYAIFGPENAQTCHMSAEQLKAANPAKLLKKIRDLKNYHQTIMYFGPAEMAEVERLVGKYHKMASHPAPFVMDYYTKEVVTKDEVIMAPYTAKNIYMCQYSNNGEVYDPQLAPEISVFNEYFGGGMNTIVFQKLRESRGLAYSASALYSTPGQKSHTNHFMTNIITQNDKMGDCLDVFHDITENLPLSESAFQLAKDAILKDIATTRSTRGGVLAEWMVCKDLGLKESPDEYIYNRVKGMTLQDLADFHAKHVKGRHYRTIILGDEQELDMEKLQQLAPIRRVTTEEIFGY